MPSCQELLADLVEEMAGSATESTLEDIKAVIDQLTFDQDGKLVVSGSGGSIDVSDLATEDTLAAIKAKTDLMTFDESNKLEVAGAGGEGGGEPLWDFYASAEEDNITSSTLTISPAFVINKTMIGNIGDETVNVVIGDLGDEGAATIPVPAGASLELMHADADTVVVTAASAGHIVYVVQGTTVKSPS